MTASIEQRKAFIPKFNEKLPITRDADDRPMSGTAVLVFQGIGLRSGTNSDTGEQFENYTLFFACLGDNGRFKNIPVRASEKVLNIAASVMEFEVPKTEKSHELIGVPGLEGFAGTAEIDWDGLKELIYPLRGLTYTGIMTREINTKNGRGYYSLDIASLKPVVVNGKTHQMQRPETTRPEMNDFNLD
jgi:hypothetical protein